MTYSRLQDTLPCDLNIVFFEFLQSSPSPNTCAPQRLGKSLECAWGCLLSLSVSILAPVCVTIIIGVVTKGVVKGKK